MISHSTSSLGPSGRNRLVSPIIRNEFMIFFVKEDSFAFAGFERTMNVNSEGKEMNRSIEERILRFKARLAVIVDMPFLY